MPTPKTAANEPRNASSDIALSMKLPPKADFEKALIRQYAKAIKMSREAGHQVSFRVVVDPLAGAQTISVVKKNRSLIRLRFRLKRRQYRMPSSRRR